MSAYNGYKYGVVNGNVQRKTQLKPMPPRLHLPGEQPEPIVTTYWERVNQKLEFSFGARPVCCQKPSDPPLLPLFCRTLDQLRRQVEMEGMEP